VVFVAQVNSMTARALSIARAVSPEDLHIVTISSNPERLLKLQQTWIQLDLGIPLRVVDSPYREFVRPATDYIKSLHPSPDHWVTVFIPEFVVEHWWEELLHNQDARRLKLALQRVPWVGVMSVPLHIGAAEAASKAKRRGGRAQEKPVGGRKAAGRSHASHEADAAKEGGGSAKSDGSRPAGKGAKKG
jgi:hypothetical protein